MKEGWMVEWATQLDLVLCLSNSSSRVIDNAAPFPIRSSLLDDVYTASGLKLSLKFR